MAGRFSFSVPGRRNASDPWFRIGTLDVKTTMLVVLAVRRQRCSSGRSTRRARGQPRPDPDGRPRRRGVAAVHVAAGQRAGHLGRSSRSPSSGTSGARSRGCSAAPGSPSCCSCSTVIPGIVGVVLDIGAGRPRAGRAGRVPRVHRRVPVRPLLLRHPGLGDRRRHRRHPGAPVPRLRRDRAASCCCS